MFAVLACAASLGSAGAQVPRTSDPVYYPPAPRSSTNTNTNSSTVPDASGTGAFPRFDEPMQSAFAKKVLEARKLERKKRMVDTANRLLVLTKQLQTDLQGREPGPEDQKRLDEIAKLAHAVKDQMRN